uniref:Uncharacterized protein n=1 Tax=Rhizophora mucronata TaxID=61149 RepID=A0A2P2P6I7_RHIMU
MLNFVLAIQFSHFGSLKIADFLVQLSVLNQ